MPINCIFGEDRKMKKYYFTTLIFSTLLLTLISCNLINGEQDQNSPTGDTVCTHEWAEATCKSPKTCTKCGLPEGGKGDHSYTDPTCDSPAMCKTCGIWYGLATGHDFAPATCEAPKTCKTCGYEKGDPAHDYIAATCTVSKTCKECGATDGTPLGHKLEKEVVVATCTADGYEQMSCTVCDFSSIIDVFPMVSHDDLSFVYNGDATVSRDGTATLACPHCNYSVTETLGGSSALIAEAFAGKKISILGDSISTYTNITSGIAADTTNSTVRDNIVWYGYSPTQPTFGGTSVDSTWWQIAINSIGATRLVNNSNAGESVFQAMTGRCMQLHDDTGDNAGEQPDIIFVYLGTNDNYRTMGSVASLNMLDIERKAANLSYTPSSLAEAYAIMLCRIQMTYPDAEIFCLTNLERSDIDIKYTHAVSQVIRDCVALFDGIHLADIGAYSGITLDSPDYLTYMPKDQGGKSIHPGAEGMKEIARVVLTSLIENSRYMTEDFYDFLPDNENESES